jgi:hypothetical protein
VGGAANPLIGLILIHQIIVTGIGILYSFAKVVPEAEIFVNELQHWIVSFFSMTLATNIICTGMLMRFPSLPDADRNYL